MIGIYPKAKVNYIMWMKLLRLGFAFRMAHKRSHGRRTNS